MEHNQDTSIKPINASSSKILVSKENQFVVLDDAKHFIGIDASDAKNLILINIENQKADKFKLCEYNYNYITNLLYDRKTGSLYTGDRRGHLCKYKINKTSKSLKKVKAYGNFGLIEITSSNRFMNFFFFGGFREKIKVLDLSTDDFLSGHLKTSIKWIRSFHVYVRKKQIYLSVSGIDPVFPCYKTDLFDLTDLLPKDQMIL